MIASCVRSGNINPPQDRRGASHAAQGHTWTQQATTLSRTASIVLREGTCHRPATMRRRIVLSARWVDSPSNQAGRLSQPARTVRMASIRDQPGQQHVRTARWADLRRRGRVCSQFVRPARLADTRTLWGRRAVSPVHAVSTSVRLEPRYALSVRLGCIAARLAEARVSRVHRASTLLLDRGHARHVPPARRTVTTTHRLRV